MIDDDEPPPEPPPDVPLIVWAGLGVILVLGFILAIRMVAG